MAHIEKCLIVDMSLCVCMKKKITQPGAIKLARKEENARYVSVASEDRELYKDLNAWDFQYIDHSALGSFFAFLLKKIVATASSFYLHHTIHHHHPSVPSPLSDTRLL